MTITASDFNKVAGENYSDKDYDFYITDVGVYIGINKEDMTMVFASEASEVSEEDIFLATMELTKYRPELVEVTI